MGEASQQTDVAQAATAYNYAVFPLSGDAEHFRAFPGVLPVGSRAPDFTAMRLDGTSVRLSDYTRQGPTVIEFDSVT